MSNLVTLESKITSRLSSGVISQVSIILQNDIGKFMDKNNLVVVCLVLSVFLQNIQAPAVTQKLIYSIFMNNVLDMIQVADTGISLINYIGIYLFSTAVINDSDIGGAAQYIFAIQVTQLFPVITFEHVVVAFLLYMAMQNVQSLRRFKDTVTLVLVSILQTWTLSVIPVFAQTPLVLIILYTVFPFMEYSALAVQIFNFLISTLTSLLSVQGVSYMYQILFVFMLMRVSTDKITSQVSELTLARLVQLQFISLVSGNLGVTDPVIVYAIIIIFLNTVQKTLEKKEK